MPETSWGIPYPASTDDVQLWTKFQALAEAVDTLLTIPDPAGQGASGSNSITLTTFSALPTTPVSCQITNPSSDFDLLVDVTISAFMTSAGTGTECQAAVSATGGLSITAGATGGSGVLSIGENLLTTLASANQFSVTIPIVIPANAATVTFALFGRRNNTSNACLILQPAIRATPIRFMAP